MTEPSPPSSQSSSPSPSQRPEPPPTSPALRIIDASLNRAREALRTIDDLARFWQQSTVLCEQAKQLRHQLSQLLCSPSFTSVVPNQLLLANRNTPGDVGTSITTPGEVSRAGLGGVAAAACARLTESLRSAEECLKTLPGAASLAHHLEQLRYRAYSLEKDLLTAIGDGRCPQWRLCVLLTQSLCKLDWRVVAQAALQAGADCLQLREKHLEAAEVLDRALYLRTLTSKAGAALIINDRIDIALASGADGVHLGQADLPIAAARSLCTRPLFIGVSTQTLDQVQAAWQAGADYCGVGPMYDTTTKDKPVIAGPIALRAYTQFAHAKPHLAIGGIAPHCIAELVEHGCRGVAVSSAICGSESPGEVCASMLAQLPPLPSFSRGITLPAACEEGYFPPTAIL